MPGSPKSFGKQLAEWLESGSEKITPAELARRIGKSPTYVSYLLNENNPSSKTGRVQPSLPVVDKIADAIGRPRAEVREAAGYRPHDLGEAAKILDADAERLLRYYSELPEDCKSDAIALLEALWRRRRAEGRAERLNSNRAGGATKFPAKLPTESPRKKRPA